MKTSIKCKYGTYELDLHEDGTVTVLSFTKRVPFRGLGDVIAAATTAVGIKPCAGCDRRKDQLNAAVPFGEADSRPEDGPERVREDEMGGNARNPPERL